MEILIIVLIVFYIVIFYFLKMRPEKQRKKEQEAMKRSLAPGDPVTMIDGIIGNVCAVKEKTIVIETGAEPCPSGVCQLGHHEQGRLGEPDLPAVTKTSIEKSLPA